MFYSRLVGSQYSGNKYFGNKIYASAFRGTHLHFCIIIYHVSTKCVFIKGHYLIINSKMSANQHACDVEARHKKVCLTVMIIPSHILQIC